MIVVTGATGQFGRLVIEGLLRTIPAAGLGVSVRDPAKADDLQRRGVRVAEGDFADPASLAAAFDGAEQVLIVSVNRLGAEAVAQHTQAIEAAKRAGARRVLYTSHQAASASSAFVPARDHAATEAVLVATGLPFVSLRNGFYAESALFPLARLTADPTLRLPADGPTSWTARADLAEAAVAALTGATSFDGISPPLTGSETLTFSQIAGLASTVLGRTVTRETIGDDDYREQLCAHGVPEPMARALGTLYLASRAAEFNVVDSTLGHVLGRAPIAFAKVLEGFLTRAAPAV